MESFQPGRLSRATLTDSAQSDLTGVCVRNSEGNQTASERILSMESAHFLDLQERKKRRLGFVAEMRDFPESPSDWAPPRARTRGRGEEGGGCACGAARLSSVGRRQKNQPIYISDTKCVYWLGFDAPSWWMVGDITLKNRWADAAYVCQGILAGRCCVEG